jgi:uncharacterized protein
MIRYAADVVVIGAGIAGVTAAIELLQRGRSVLLLDRDAETNMRGLARESFGGLWFAGTARGPKPTCSASSRKSSTRKPAR